MIEDPDVGPEPPRLSSELLDRLRIPAPTYDRSHVTTGIVHFGVGGFHRSHQASYTDELLERGEAQDFGICGVGVLPGDGAMRDALVPQDCLYTLVVRDAHPGSEPAETWQPRVVGSIVRYLLAPSDPEAVLETLADPAVRIVSLTVTEGGYSLDPVTGRFDPSDAGIQADLHPGAPPSTTFGLVVEGLARRRARGIEPFTVLSCDNIPGNGGVAREAFSGFARLRDPDLGDWVEAHVRFPNSMVDRITPGTTEEDRAEVTERLGYRDAWPVVCEPFSQWVVEDDFSLGRPAWEDVGVQIVADVEPYELMKLRLLNASHQALCYFGYLAGFRLVHEAAQDPTVARFLLAYMEREATPTLAPVPGMDLDSYRHQLIERFGNSAVRDTVARLCAESSDRIPKFLLPVVRENLAAGRDVALSAAVVASWARYAEGVDEQGQPIKVVDRLAETLTATALRQRSDPLAFVENRQLFGDLVDQPAFVTPYGAALASLHAQGARATLESLGF